MKALPIPLLPNPAVDLAPFGRWTLRDEAAQRRRKSKGLGPFVFRFIRRIDGKFSVK